MKACHWSRQDLTKMRDDLHRIALGRPNGFDKASAVHIKQAAHTAALFYRHVAGTEEAV